MTIAQLVDPIVAFLSGDCIGVISDPFNKYVEIDQVYRDKATLKFVMEQFTITKRFQYRTLSQIPSDNVIRTFS